MGGQTLELAFHGPNHTPDNIFIWAPGQHTLMLVDVIFPRWAPFKNVAVSQDILGWIQAQHIAMSYPCRWLIAVLHYDRCVRIVVQEPLLLIVMRFAVSAGGA